jgi:hypothetical protein
LLALQASDLGNPGEKFKGAHVTHARKFAGGRLRRRVVSGLEAQQKPGTYGRQAGDERRRGGSYFGKGARREVPTGVGEIVEVVPPEE